MNIEQIFTMQFELIATQLNLIWIQNLKLSSNRLNGIHIWTKLNFVELNSTKLSIFNYEKTCVNLPFHIHVVGLVKILR
jgi:hypothetical protein